MGRLRDKMEGDLKLRGVSENTRKTYLYCAAGFVRPMSLAGLPGSAGGTRLRPAQGWRCGGELAAIGEGYVGRRGVGGARILGSSVQARPLLQPERSWGKTSTTSGVGQS